MADGKGLPSDPAAALQVMIDQLALVSSTEQVMTNAEARKQLELLQLRVQDVVTNVRAQLEEAEQKKRLGADIDALIDTVATIQSEVGRSVANQKDKLKAASRAETLGKMAEALQLLSNWLGNPTAENQTKVEQLVENIRAVTGASPFYDEAKAEAQRKAELEASVKKSLDQIFGELKIKPPL
jgi:hypothetical protein